MTTPGRLASLLGAAVALSVLGVAAIAAAPFAGIAVLGGGLVLASGAAALVIFVGWLSLARSRPRLDGTVEMSGVEGQITIRRDRLGTPHVAARSDRDACFGLGVVMAQDRLWQMDLLRRAASGALAEVAGPSAVELDAYARTIGLRRIAEREVEGLAAGELDLLDAFTAGINAVVGERAGRVPAFEFGLLRYAPEPWSVVDSLAIAKALGWLLSSSLEASLLALSLDRRLGPELTAMLLGPSGGERPAPLDRGVSDGVAALDRRFRDAVGGGGGASNVWAIAGRHTRSGRPILANDIHLGVEYTIRLYEARLDAPSLRVTGVFLPGAPFAVAGTNGMVAWGATNTGAAVSDVYVEQLSPDGAAARNGDAWEPLGEIVEQIAIRGAPARRVRIRTTRHGPVVSDLVPTVRAGEGRALALRWIGAESGPPASALLGIMRSSDWESFNRACDGWTVPAITFGYADGDGHIGLRVAGCIPRRTADGLLPLDGSDPRNDWAGHHPASANPRQLDPPAGWVASANNLPPVVARDDLGPITWLPEPPYRFRRIVELIESFIDRGRPVSVEEMGQMQRDTVSLQAVELLPALLARLGDAELSVAETAARRHLEDWNRNVTVESVAASVWESWYQHWLVGLLRHRLDPAEVTLALEIARTNPGNVPWMLADRGDLDRWIGDANANELAQRAFREAVAQLRAQRGSDESEWNWGSLHQTTWAHPAARSRPLTWLFNRGPYPAAGDGITVHATEHRLTDPYATTLMPASRLLVDLGEPERPRFSTHPGQSGHPLSIHFDDRIAEYRRGATHVTPLTLAPADVAHELILRPR